MKLPYLKTLIVACLISAGVVMAQGYGPGYGMGPGMMGGDGPYGMGPGMMQGYGPYGMGPGMMRRYGYGMGPGMMGGPGCCGGGYGPGYAYGALNLTPEQQTKLGEMQQQFAHKRFDLAAKLEQDQYRLNQLYASNAESATLEKAYQAVANDRKALFDADLDAQKSMNAVLSKEQHEQLRRNSAGRY